MATLPQSRIETSVDAPKTIRALPTRGRFDVLLYGALLALSISLWFVAFRAPLWLDETGSWWQISQGFWKIPSRQGGLSFPAYSYILWTFTKILSTGEIALRIPSVLAVLGAVYLLYRAAMEIFGREIALVTAVLFAVHPIVIFEAIDVRPYAFAALAVNASLFLLVRLRCESPAWMPILLGISVAVIVYFHFLFAVILPFMLLCLLARVVIGRQVAWKQAGIAIVACAVALLPVAPGLLYMVRSRGTHVFEAAPPFRELTWTLAPGSMFYIFVAALLAAAALRRLDLENRVNAWALLLGTSVGLAPLFILWAVSAWTPIHMFTDRHRLVAIPGIALGWAFLLSRINSRALRVLFCLVVVGMAAYKSLSNPAYKQHGYTWKYALAFAEKTAAPDHAPVLIASDLPESDYEPMPSANVQDSHLFIPLSYYKVTAPVVPLPRTLNDEARRVVLGFLADPSRSHQRFLAMGFVPSWPTLQWLASSASPTHEVRVLGQFDEIVVLEFVPRVP